MGLYDQNWDINSYNKAYGNTNVNERFQGENEIYGNMDRNMNYRGPDPFGSFNSGVGSFYNQRPVYPSDNDLDANWANESIIQAPERTGILKTIKNWGGNILDNTIMGKIAGGFDATNPRAFNYNPALQGQIDFLKSKGAYGTDQSGLNKITSGVLAGKNLQSMFGTNDLAQMYENQLAKYEKTYANLDEQWGDTLDDEELAAKKLRYFNKFIKPARMQQSQLLGDQQKATEEGIDLTKITDPGKGTVPTGGAAVTTGGGGVFNPRMDPKGRRDTRDSWHGATAARGDAGKQVAGPGFGRGAYWADGGRVGYKRGRVVNPGGYAGEEEFEDENVLEFMKDQNVPHSEMVEGESPFDIRVQELVDEGMSWQQAWSIASQEFGLLAEGQEDSFSDQGLASLV